MEQEYIQRRPPTEYSEVRNQFTGISVPFQHVGVGNQMTDGLYPIQSSYSDLSERCSQDSAYCSRYSSSASVVNPISRSPISLGSDFKPGSGRGPVHERFSSWPDSDQQTVPPSTSRITSEEDVSKYARPLAERNYNRMAGTASQSWQDFHKQNAYRHPHVSTRSLGFDSDSQQAVKTNSFSAVQSQPTGLSSPPYLLQHNSKSDRPGSVNDWRLKGDISPVKSQPSYNSMTQNEPVTPCGEPLSTNKHDIRNPENRGVVQLGYSSGDSRLPASPRQLYQGFSLSENFSETENSQGRFGPGRDDAHHFTSSQDISCRSTTDALRGCDDIEDSNQTSMLRQLSRELYAQKLGIGLKGKKSFGGGRHPRLGSIDENSQSLTTSNISPASHNPDIYNRLSYEMEKHSKNPSCGFEGEALSPNSCPLSPGFSSNRPSVEEPEKPGFIAGDDDDLGDGCNFVRNRKCQMSLRKAFGIFDEFEISDDAVRNQSALPVRPLQEIARNSRECDPSNRPASDDHVPISMRSKPSTSFQSRSSLTKVTRHKSSSMPRQPTIPLLSQEEEDRDYKHLNLSYANADVLQESHPSKFLHGKAEFPMTIGEGLQLDEVCKSVSERCEAGKFGDLIGSPRSTLKSSSSSQWSGSTWKDDSAEVVPAGSTTSCTSFPPPVLPPRRYRKGGATDDHPSAGPAPDNADLYSANVDMDEDSTLRRDSYTRCLRQHANRLSQSRVSGTSFSHSLHQLMPSLTSAIADGANSVSVDWQNPTARCSSISGRLPSSNECLEKSSPGGVCYSDQTKTSAQCYEMEQSSKKSSGFQGMTSIDMPNVSRNSVTVKAVSSVDLDENCSVSPSAGDGLLPSSDFSGHKVHPRSPTKSPGSYGVCSNPGASVSTAVFRSQNLRDDTKSAIDDQNVSSAPEAEVGVRYCPIVTAQKSGGKKKKADMAVVQPNVRSAEPSAEKRASSSPSDCETSMGQSPSRLGKVTGYPRPLRPTSESKYDRATAVPFQIKSNEEAKVSFESSACQRPVNNIQLLKMENEPSRFSKSSHPVLIAGGQKQSGEKHIADTTIDNKRMQFESISSDRPRSFLHQQSPNQQRHQTETLPSEKPHKTTADYMTNLFTRAEEDGSTIQPDALTRNSFQRASLRSHLMAAKQTKNKTKNITGSLLHEEDKSVMDEQQVATSQSFCRNSGDDMQDISEEEKLDLIAVLEKKLEGLREERQLLNEEIIENNALGKKVTAVVEQKLSAREFSKYRSYVDELEKVLCLTLKLSERLAKAENAMLALPQNASDKEKATLILKRDDLLEKHNDALLLKEGIERRRDQVDGYLRNCLSRDELKDYEYFLKMKAQLVVDQQEVEDRVEMGRQQLELLKCTVNCDSGSRSGSYICPKSDR